MVPDLDGAEFDLDDSIMKLCAYAASGRDEVLKALVDNLVVDFDRLFAVIDGTPSALDFGVGQRET